MDAHRRARGLDLLGVRAAREQRPRAFGVPFARANVEWREAVGVGRVGARLGSEQRSRATVVAVRAANEERRHAADADGAIGARAVL